MRTLLIAVVGLIAGFPVARAQETALRLTITVKNVKSEKGVIKAALYQSDEQFKKKSFQSTSVPSKKGEVQLVFNDIKPGDYAVSIIHDANTNGDLDSNAMGIPKEGFGFSNNAMGMFGPPGFDKARFTLSADLEITITLKYF